LAVPFDSFTRTKTTRNMVAGDQIVDSSSITNNSGNNDRRVDGDFKRVNEVLESSKACIFQSNLFSL